MQVKILSKGVVEYCYRKLNLFIGFKMRCKTDLISPPFKIDNVNNEVHTWPNSEPQSQTIDILCSSQTWNKSDCEPT